MKRRRHPGPPPVLIGRDGRVLVADMDDVSDHNCHYCDKQGFHIHELRHAK